MYRNARRASFSAALIAIFTLLTSSFIQAQATVECGDGFRLFEHELLATDPVCIPEDPQRILVLDLPAMEVLLFTDKEVVGTLDWVRDDLAATLPALEDELADIPLIGWPPNLEAILALSPDLIVGYQNEAYFEAYDQLSEIAPSVILSSALGYWKPATEFWSEVFNVPEVYEEMEATYDARVAELQDALGDDIADFEVSVVHTSSYFTLIWLAESAQGQILADVGFGRPESQQYSGEEAIALYGYADYAGISDETLELAYGDAIFLFAYATSNEEELAANSEHMEAFQASPLWQSLSAVQAGQSFVVGPHWYRAATYLVANAILDDLFATLTETEATTPNPIVQFRDTEAE